MTVKYNGNKPVQVSYKNKLIACTRTNKILNISKSNFGVHRSNCVNSDNSIKCRTIKRTTPENGFE